MMFLPFLTRNSLSLDSEGERGPLSGNQCVRSWIELRLAQAQVTDGRLFVKDFLVKHNRRSCQ